MDLRLHPTKHGKTHFWRHCKTNLAGLQSSLTPLSSDSGERQEGQMWVDIFKVPGLEAIEEAGNATGETKAELLLDYVLPWSGSLVPCYSEEFSLLSRSLVPSFHCSGEDLVFVKSWTKTMFE